MKRIIVLLLLCFTVNLYAAEENLYNRFKDYPRIRVHLKEVLNEEEDSRVDVSAFKEVFKDVLVKRLNIEFVPVDTAEEADVIITARIKDYAFKEKAMPRFYSTWSLVADTTAPKSAATLVVDYAIINPKDGEMLLLHKNFTIDERRPIEDMEDEKGFKHAAAKNVNRFIYRAFHKQRKR